MNDLIWMSKNWLPRVPKLNLASVFGILWLWGMIYPWKIERLRYFTNSSDNRHCTVTLVCYLTRIQTKLHLTSHIFYSNTVKRFFSLSLDFCPDYATSLIRLDFRLHLKYIVPVFWLITTLHLNFNSSRLTFLLTRTSMHFSCFQTLLWHFPG